jgi:glutamate dehydrogenase
LFCVIDYRLANMGRPSRQSFTTGKSASALGGIPHDVYGMTSLSVRQYLLGLYRTHGLTEKNVTKVQIGGPDGDLGSNEILLSNDKTV